MRQVQLTWGTDPGLAPFLPIIANEHRLNVSRECAMSCPAPTDMSALLAELLRCPEGLSCTAIITFCQKNKTKNGPKTRHNETRHVQEQPHAHNKTNTTSPARGGDYKAATYHTLLINSSSRTTGCCIRIQPRLLATAMYAVHEKLIPLAMTPKAYFAYHRNM